MTPDVRTIEAGLIDYLENDPRIEGSVEADTELIESGTLDSLAILDLVVFVEERFGVELVAEDIAPRHFGSVARLASLIEARR